MRSLFALLLFFPFLVIAQSGNALLFDGSSTLEISDADALNFSGAHTIEAWVRTDCNASGNQVFASKQHCDWGQWGYYVSVFDGKLFYGFTNNGDCRSVSLYETDEALVTPGAFHHVAVTHDQNTITLYVDGVPRSGNYVRGGFASIRPNRQAFRIGCYLDRYSDRIAHFSGALDNLRYWRRALTPTEVARWMEERPASDNADLVLDLDMENGGGSPSLTLQNQATQHPNLIAHTVVSQPSPQLGEPDLAFDAMSLIQQVRNTCEDTDPEYFVDDRRLTNIRWSNGSTTPRVTIPGTDPVWVSATFDNCLEVSDTYVPELTEFEAFKLFLPTAISPNGDNVNDCFRAFFGPTLRVEEFRLSVYDRWGGLVYESEDPNGCWDGKVKGQISQGAVYAWTLMVRTADCSKQELRSGALTIVPFARP